MNAVVRPASGTCGASLCLAAGGRGLPLAHLRPEGLPVAADLQHTAESVLGGRN